MAGKGSEEDDDGGGMGKSVGLFSSLSWHGKSLISFQPFLPKMERRHRSVLPRVSEKQLEARTNSKGNLQVTSTQTTSDQHQRKKSKLTCRSTTNHYRTIYNAEVLSKTLQSMFLTKEQ
jgi:hypothetical protein